MPNIQGADSPRELRKILMRAVDTQQPLNPQFVAHDIKEWEEAAVTDQDRRTLDSLRKLEFRNHRNLDFMMAAARASAESEPEPESETLPGYENIVSEEVEDIDPNAVFYHGTQANRFDRFEKLGNYDISLAVDYHHAYGYSIGSETSRSSGDSDLEAARVIAARLDLEDTPHGWRLPRFQYTEEPDIDPELIGQANWSGIHNESAERAEELGYPGYILGNSGEVVIFDGDNIEIVSHDYQGGPLPERNRERDTSPLSDALHEYQQASHDRTREPATADAGMSRTMEYRATSAREPAYTPRRGRGRMRY